MRILTFAELHAEVAAFHAAEAERNAPVNVAVNAIDTLRAALEGCTAVEREDVLALLADEFPALRAPAPCDFDTDMLATA